VSENEPTPLGPSVDELAAQGVRLLLWFIDEDGPDHLVPQCERMWALVEAREGDAIRGRLASPPLSARAALEMGELIQFRPTDAIDVLDPEDDWHEHRSFLRAIFDGDDAFEEWKRRIPASWSLARERPAWSGVTTQRSLHARGTTREGPAAPGPSR
jgi:hypothetical protein